MSLITREIEGTRLRYDTEAGKFERWFTGGAGKPPRWKETGLPAKGSHGYRKIRIGKKKVSAHRLAWFMYYGVWPDFIDHINHDKGDNRLLNLANVTFTENQRNKPKCANNRTGVMGVFQCSHSRWTAQIGVNGEIVYLGSFGSLEAAVNRRKTAEIEYGFHPNHGVAK